jgi:hypothetical protein
LKGRRYFDAAAITAWTQHFDTSRRSISPTAIGRMDPSFFNSGTNEALAMKVAKDGKAFPDRNRFTTDTKASRKRGTPV